MEEKKIQGKIAEKTEAKPEEKKIKVERETQMVQQHRNE